MPARRPTAASSRSCTRNPSSSSGSTAAGRVVHNGPMMRPTNGVAGSDRLQAAVSELSRHETEPTVFSNQLAALVGGLAQSGVRLPANALEPLYAAFGRHLAAPVKQVNLGDFARLSQAAFQLWQVSGRDMALRDITEDLATRF